MTVIERFYNQENWRAAELISQQMREARETIVWPGIIFFGKKDRKPRRNPGPNKGPKGERKKGRPGRRPRRRPGRR